MVPDSFLFPGAAGGFTTSLVKQGLNIGSGTQCGFDPVSLTLDTGIGATTGLLPSLGIQGITTGRNSYVAIGKQIATKLDKGQISNVTAPTAAKIAIGAQAEGIPGFGAGLVATGIGSYFLSPSGCPCK